MDIVLITCVVGLMNVFGLQAVSDTHLANEGYTKQQLEQEALESIQQKNKRQTSLQELIQAKSAVDMNPSS